VAESKGGGASIADTMGVIGLVESGGNPRARNPSGAAGLWQILGQLVPGNLFNPGVNALNAIAKYKAQGLQRVGRVPVEVGSRCSARSSALTSTRSTSSTSSPASAISPTG
jgi:hypothetical protein